ncbi:conserved Plasmodium protein, unknown function [Plasmodium ovale]|uniref:Transcription factor with AP2 domain(S) n=1 Tax=Plasmodium ovale TaxID=36330 RepID=A0A1D3TI75_PLAOA|nr:conserved Plasmodium protein, unknown function [Plasmodium ovale]
MKTEKRITLSITLFLLILISFKKKEENKAKMMKRNKKHHKKEEENTNEKNEKEKYEQNDNTRKSFDNESSMHYKDYESQISHFKKKRESFFQKINILQKYKNYKIKKAASAIQTEPGETSPSDGGGYGRGYGRFDDDKCGGRKESNRASRKSYSIKDEFNNLKHKAQALKKSISFSRKGHMGILTSKDINSSSEIVLRTDNANSFSNDAQSLKKDFKIRNNKMIYDEKDMSSHVSIFSKDVNSSNVDVVEKNYMFRQHSDVEMWEGDKPCKEITQLSENDPSNTNNILNSNRNVVDFNEYSYNIKREEDNYFANSEDPQNYANDEDVKDAIRNHKHSSTNGKSGGTPKKKVNEVLPVQNGDETMTGTLHNISHNVKNVGNNVVYKGKENTLIGRVKLNRKESEDEVEGEEQEKELTRKECTPGYYGQYDKEEGTCHKYEQAQRGPCGYPHYVGDETLLEDMRNNQESIAQKEIILKLMYNDKGIYFNKDENIVEYIPSEEKKYPSRFSSEEKGEFAWCTKSGEDTTLSKLENVSSKGSATFSKHVSDIAGNTMENKPSPIIQHSGEGSEKMRKTPLSSGVNSNYYKHADIPCFQHSADRTRFVRKSTNGEDNIGFHSATQTRNRCGSGDQNEIREGDSGSVGEEKSSIISRYLINPLYSLFASTKEEVDYFTTSYEETKNAQHAAAYGALYSESTKNYLSELHKVDKNVYDVYGVPNIRSILQIRSGRKWRGEAGENFPFDKNVCKNNPPILHRKGEDAQQNYTSSPNENMTSTIGMGKQYFNAKCSKNFVFRENAPVGLSKEGETAMGNQCAYLKRNIPCNNINNSCFNDIYFNSPMVKRGVVMSDNFERRNENNPSSTCDLSFHDMTKRKVPNLVDKNAITNKHIPNDCFKNSMNTKCYTFSRNNTVTNNSGKVHIYTENNRRENLRKSCTFHGSCFNKNRMDTTTREKTLHMCENVLNSCNSIHGYAINSHMDRNSKAYNGVQGVVKSGDHFNYLQKRNILANNYSMHNMQNKFREDNDFREYINQGKGNFEQNGNTHMHGYNKFLNGANGRYYEYIPRRAYLQNSRLESNETSVKCYPFHCTRYEKDKLNEKNYSHKKKQEYIRNNFRIALNELKNENLKKMKGYSLTPRTHVNIQKSEENAQRGNDKLVYRSEENTVVRTKSENQMRGAISNSKSLDVYSQCYVTDVYKRNTNHAENHHPREEGNYNHAYASVTQSERLSPLVETFSNKLAEDSEILFKSHLNHKHLGGGDKNEDFYLVEESETSQFISNQSEEQSDTDRCTSPTIRHYIVSNVENCHVETGDKEATFADDSVVGSNDIDNSSNFDHLTSSTREKGEPLWVASSSGAEKRICREGDMYTSDEYFSKDGERCTDIMIGVEKENVNCLLFDDIPSQFWSDQEKSDGRDPQFREEMFKKGNYYDISNGQIVIGKGSNGYCAGDDNVGDSLISSKLRGGNSNVRKNDVTAGKRRTKGTILCADKEKNNHITKGKSAKSMGRNYSAGMNHNGVEKREKMCVLRKGGTVSAQSGMKKKKKIFQKWVPQKGAHQKRDLQKGKPLERRKENALRTYSVASVNKIKSICSNINDKSCKGESLKRVNVIKRVEQSVEVNYTFDEDIINYKKESITHSNNSVRILNKTKENEKNAKGKTNKRNGLKKGRMNYSTSVQSEVCSFEEFAKASVTMEGGTFEGNISNMSIKRTDCEIATPDGKRTHRIPNHTKSERAKGSAKRTERMKGKKGENEEREINQARRNSMGKERKRMNQTAFCTTERNASTETPPKLSKGKKKKKKKGMIRNGMTSDKGENKQYIEIRNKSVDDHMGRISNNPFRFSIVKRSLPISKEEIDCSMENMQRSNNNPKLTTNETEECNELKNFSGVTNLLNEKEQMGYMKINHTGHISRYPFYEEFKRIHDIVRNRNNSSFLNQITLDNLISIEKKFINDNIYINKHAITSHMKRKRMDDKINGNDCIVYDNNFSIIYLDHDMIYLKKNFLKTVLNVLLHDRFSFYEIKITIMLLCFFISLEDKKTVPSSLFPLSLINSLICKFRLKIKKQKLGMAEQSDDDFYSSPSVTMTDMDDGADNAPKKAPFHYLFICDGENYLCINDNSRIGGTHKAKVEINNMMGYYHYINLNRLTHYLERANCNT